MPRQKRRPLERAASRLLSMVPGSLLAVTSAVCALNALYVEAADTEDLAKACVDNDARWAAYNSSCAQMRWLCDSEGYGMLVRSWCPRTCGLCKPTIAENVVETDTISLVSRYATLDSATVRKDGRRREPDEPLTPEQGMLHRRRAHLSAVRNASGNGTSGNGTDDEFISQHLFEGAFAQGMENGSNETSSPMTWPEEWEVTMPLQDALVDAATKAVLLPRALWSPGQEHFVFEVNGTSDNESTITTSTTEASVKPAPRSKRMAGRLRRQGCPPGYERVVGHVYGSDQFGKGYDLYTESIRQCGKLCYETPGCGSFSYSSSRKRCFRHSHTKPTDLVDRRQYIFCRRTPCPSFLTESACVGPAVAAGYHSKDVRLQPGSYCIWSAGKCQAPMACTSEDCFLPDGGLPGMDLPPRYTLWITRGGLMSSMAPLPSFSL
mmetsp:Transcript_59771/g.112787  ORF Transcript_59771/g.112787 Transcript_59771/m.112787 type:complete len:436 (-) Transcript_59771:92-1399(-)